DVIEGIGGKVRDRFRRHFDHPAAGEARGLDEISGQLAIRGGVLPVGEEFLVDERVHGFIPVGGCRLCPVRSASSTSSGQEAQRLELPWPAGNATELGSKYEGRK